MYKIKSMPCEKTSTASDSVNKEKLTWSVTKCCRRKNRQELAISQWGLEDRFELVIHPTVSLREDENLPALTGWIVEWAECDCRKILHPVHPVDGNCAVVGPGDRGEVGWASMQTWGRRKRILDQRPRPWSHVCRHQGNGWIGGACFGITELVMEEVLEERIAWSVSLCCAPASIPALTHNDDFQKVMRLAQKYSTWVEGGCQRWCRQRLHRPACCCQGSTKGLCCPRRFPPHSPSWSFGWFWPPPVFRKYFQISNIHPVRNPIVNLAVNSVCRHLLILALCCCPKVVICNPSLGGNPCVVAPVVDVVVVIDIGDGISSWCPCNQSYVLGSASLKITTSVGWTQTDHLRQHFRYDRSVLVTVEDAGLPSWAILIRP